MLATTEPVNLSMPARFHLLNRERLRRKAYCKVPLQIETKQFTVKTVANREEFLEVMELRHRVFQREFAGKKFCLRSDRDAFDSAADFLVVVDNASQRIVGTYRLICSRFSQRFYSSTEFDITSLQALPGVKVELSRACILREYRSGRVISLLWKGLATYMESVNAKYFFGCGSVQSMDPSELASIRQQFESMGVMSHQFHFPVRKKYQLTATKAATYNQGAQFEVPSLIRAYLKAGAVVCSEPAIDKKFRCADFLVVMDTDEINMAYRQKYTRQ